MDREPSQKSTGKTDKLPLFEKMYFRQHYIDLIRMVGYSGLPVSEAQTKIRELPHDKEKLVAACEELFDIDAKEVKLKAHVRKLAHQLLGFPPEYKETPIREALGLDTPAKPEPPKETPKPAKAEPRPKKPRQKKAEPKRETESKPAKTLPDTPIMQQFASTRTEVAEMQTVPSSIA